MLLSCLTWILNTVFQPFLPLKFWQILLNCTYGVIFNHHFYGIVNHVQFFTLQFSNPFLLLPRSASTQMLTLSLNHPKQKCTWRCRTLLLKWANHRYWSMPSALTLLYRELVPRTPVYAMHWVMSVLCVVNEDSCSIVYLFLQYLSVVELLESIDYMVKNGPYRKFRPDVPVIKHARQWWVLNTLDAYW